MVNEEVSLWIEQAKSEQIFINQSTLNIEKALKSLFLKKNGTIPKVHDLVFLAKKLDLPEKLFQYCKQISPLYMPARYPDAPGFKKSSDYSFNECKDVVKKAEEIIIWIDKNL